MNPLEWYIEKCGELIGYNRLKDKFASYKKIYEQASIPLLFHEYVSAVIVTTGIVFVVVFVILPTADIFLKFLGAMLASLLLLFLLYIYPMERVDSRKKKIDAELPLALNYMAALLGSGAPPITAFSMLADFEEYEEISKEARRIARDCNVLGMDLPTALERESEKCPSKQFREILKSLKSEIISGGNITRFFEEKAEDRMAHYERQQEEYERVSDTLGSIYLVVALVAPLLFITGIAIIDFISSSGVGDLIGGAVVSPEITFQLLVAGVFVGIPLINIMFIIIVKMTQPEVI